ncbi:hypothetical protein EVAR_7238_1 [Eumeta japonica]|uniref:Uncharacterized protein n=1 Tax=Eumeta variegata TaxID=151549 RepID=A0A4C1T2A4_EUMVA|nr:hypothetical protein EVAR_7238_1 [Eumeta japonica]
MYEVLHYTYLNESYRNIPEPPVEIQIRVATLQILWEDCSFQFRAKKRASHQRAAHRGDARPPRTGEDPAGGERCEGLHAALRRRRVGLQTRLSRSSRHSRARPLCPDVVPSDGRGAERIDSIDAGQVGPVIS